MRITLKIIPNARQTELVDEFAGVWRVRVAAPPRENKANQKLVKWLADKFGLPKSGVRIYKGHTSSIKMVDIAGEWKHDEIKAKLR